VPKTVLITGATDGLGRGVAQQLAAGGERLHIHGRDPERLAKTKRDIAEATGNGALVHVTKLLWDERSGPLYQQLEHHYDAPELWRAAMSEHRAVLKSIAARDPEAARAAMQRHLNKAYKRFSKGWNARP
jgi:DNA-binding GntR family transcriptional regulator